MSEPRIVYDDQHPRGRQVQVNVDGSLYLTQQEAYQDFQQRLDRIENLLVTILGHTSPQEPKVEDVAI